MINVQNIDNECFKWCLVRYLHPADHNPMRIRKADKDFPKRLDFKDTEFPVKTRNIHKTEKKKSSISISVFGYENKEKYQSKNVVKKNVDLLLTGEESKRHYVLVKNVNTFMYDHTL